MRPFTTAYKHGVRKSWKSGALLGVCRSKQCSEKKAFIAGLHPGFLHWSQKSHFCCLVTVEAQSKKRSKREKPVGVKKVKNLHFSPPSVNNLGISDELKQKLQDVMVDRHKLTLGKTLGEGL